MRVRSGEDCGSCFKSAGRGTDYLRGVTTGRSGQIENSVQHILNGGIRLGWGRQSLDAQISLSIVDFLKRRENKSGFKKREKTVIS